MSKRFNLVTRQLLHKDLEECSLEEVEQLAAAYPYFAPAQFALLKKLETEKDRDRLRLQTQKAALYHHQPLSFAVFTDTLDELVLQEPLSAETNHIEEAAPAEEVSANAVQADMESAGPVSLQPAANGNSQTVQEEPAAPPPALVQPKATEAITFEPYHTVDYFASLGIKLSQEETAKDNFGKQLKSFTEWLRTMKRLPAAEQVKSLDAVSEKKVEHMAAHSVEDTDIVTEAMAEVWVKQGNKQKAMEVYNKLSLLNPSKMAYFAAKLENLKK